MSVRSARTSRRWLWFTVLVIGCMIAGMQSNPAQQGPTGAPADVVATVGQPVESAITKVTDGASDGWSFVTGIFDLQRENTRLRQQSERAAAQAEQLEEYRQEVERLRSLLRLSAPLNRPAVSGRVIATGPSAWFRTLTANVGRKSGLRPGAAVLAPGGLVGQVYQVSYTSSKILALTDRLGSVGARVQPERARQVVGICKGNGTDSLTLIYEDAAADVRPGDPVVTSGQQYGSLFPPGLLVGHVIAVERRPDETSLILTIRPAVDPDRVEEVLILLPEENSLTGTSAVLREPAG